MTDLSRHPLDAFVIDPTGMTSPYDEPTFAALLDEMVADEAPRLFAVVQEYGRRIDGQIAGWGMAFDDHTEVISVDQPQWMRLSSPSQALRMFRFGTHITPRLIWAPPPPPDHPPTPTAHLATADDDSGADTPIGDDGVDDDSGADTPIGDD